MPVASGFIRGSHHRGGSVGLGTLVKSSVKTKPAKKSRVTGVLHTVLGAVLSVAIFSAGPVNASSSESSLDRPAIKSPKAANSLLLDVTRTDGGVRLVSVGERGHIVFSDDHGVSWQQASVPTMQMLTAVHFPSEKVGYAVGHDAIVLKTENGGETWLQVYVDREATIPLLDVWFEDNLHGFAVGAYGYIIETVDGGQSWDFVDDRVANDDEFHYNAINDDGQGNLFLAGEAGILYRSTDAGKTWTTLNSPYEGSWFGVSGDDGQVLVHGLRGNIYQSQDQGETWQPLSSGTEQTLFGSAKLIDGSVALVGNSGAVLTGSGYGAGLSSGAKAGLSVSHRPDRMTLSALAPSNDGFIVVVGQGGAYRMTLEGNVLE
ncbi:WD40/YVTN/BNR-like repeat-containing protein [Endozoicomonas elysicola]|uniref:WD40/YVTN/BNR-like repeat-containing protein n=1 Tax=Endozoicomonas elysicola TaxID=305900 RepID=UPI00035E66C6|nr:YCF48-related protein [Endozoicomonas elysicola]